MLGISLEQLRCFVALAEGGSFTQAEKILRKAKSAIRYSVGSLEDQLGCKLLDRDSYRTKLTKSGEDVYQQCLQFLKQYETFEHNCLQISSRIENSIGISVTDLLGTREIMPKVKKLMSLFPETEILLEREILSGEKMLKNRSVDIALFENMQDRLSIEYKRLTKVRLLAVLHKDHPFQECEDQNINALYRYPQITQRSTLPSEETKGVLDKARVWRVSDTLAKKELIYSGLGWGRLPAHVISKELETGEFVSLETFIEALEVEIFIGRRRGERHGKVSEAFWEMFS